MPQQPDGSSASHLARLRHARGLSQEELAERSGVSARSIRNLERGVVARPRRATLEALASALALDDETAEDLNAALRGQPTPYLSRPAQLPAADTGFIGRTQELAQLNDALMPTVRRPEILVIEGSGGLGKTQLALHWAQSVKSAFPDGQLFARLHGFSSGSPTDAEDVLADFLSALGVPAAAMPGNLTARSALFRSMLAGKRMLLVLDDAADHDQLEPLLPGTGSCTTLVTTRRRMVAMAARYGAERVQLGPMNAHDAEAMLAASGVPAGTAAQRSQVIQACGGLPLALRILSCQAQDFGWSHVLDRLETQATLDAVSSAADAMDVRQVLSTSVEPLSLPALELFALTGLASTPDISLHALAAMADRTVAATKELAGELIALHLVGPRGDHLLVHDLVQQYAIQLVTEWPREARETAEERLAAFIVDVAEAASRDRRPLTAKMSLPRRAGPETLRLPTRPMDWLKAHPAHLRDAIDHVCAQRTGGLALRLADAVGDRLAHMTHEFDARGLYAAGAQSARAARDDAGLSRCLGQLGQHKARNGDWLASEELLHEALGLAQQIGDALSEGGIQIALAQSHYLVGRYERALEALQRGIDLLQQGGRAVPSEIAMNNIALLLTQLGRYEEADALMQQLLERDPSESRFDSRSITFSNIAGVQLLRDNPHDASHSFEEALRIGRTSSDHTVLAGTLLDLAKVQVLMGELVRAEESLAETETLLPTAATPRLRSSVDNCRGELAAARGELPLAQERFSAAAERARRCHDRQELERAIMGLRALSTSASGARSPSP